jgi:hypothetical protein
MTAALADLDMGATTPENKVLKGDRNSENTADFFAAHESWKGRPEVSL